MQGFEIGEFFFCWCIERIDSKDAPISIHLTFFIFCRLAGLCKHSQCDDVLRVIGQGFNECILGLFIHPFVKVAFAKYKIGKRVIGIVRQSFV